MEQHLILILETYILNIYLLIWGAFIINGWKWEDLEAGYFKFYWGYMLFPLNLRVATYFVC